MKKAPFMNGAQGINKRGQASSILAIGLMTFSMLSTADTDLAAEGMVNVKSSHSVAATADKLVTILSAKGMTIFNRIDHAAGAQKVGQSLRPTELVVFGSSKIGSKLMKCSQTVAIDLPQKALVWQDKAGAVCLSYNNPIESSQNTQRVPTIKGQIPVTLIKS